MPDESETKLIEASAGGDIESFGELCRRYYPAMVAVGYSDLGDHQLAEDAAQESFARALVSLRKLKSQTRFAPWLAVICRNVAKDMVAIKARQINTNNFLQPVQDNNHDENHRLINRAIDQLPISDKELIVLRYYDGLSYEEISSVLGISGPSINGRITRAKRKIAKYLKHNGFPENQL